MVSTVYLLLRYCTAQVSFLSFNRPLERSGGGGYHKSIVVIIFYFVCGMLFDRYDKTNAKSLWCCQMIVSPSGDKAPSGDTIMFATEMLHLFTGNVLLLIVNITDTM